MPGVDVLLDSGQAKMTAMSIYKIQRRTEPFGVSFRVCDSNDASVESCDQFLAHPVEPARLFCLHAARLRAGPSLNPGSWLHASGGNPDPVTRQIVGGYITEFARGARQGAVSAHSSEKPRQPRTINHRLSVLASYFEYCIRRDTEDGRGPWKGSHQGSFGQPSRRGTASRDDRARLRRGAPEATGRISPRRIPRTLPKILEAAAIQKLIDSGAILSR